jgi:DNA-binding transcriptional MocR family regulator
MALDARGNTIYCSSFSRTLAPGYRTGWIATARHLQRVLASKFAMTLCGPALPQAALVLPVVGQPRSSSAPPPSMSAALHVRGTARRLAVGPRG